MGSGGGEAVLLNFRLESTESGRYVVLVEMFQDFGNVGFHVCYIGGPEDPVVVRDYWLEFGVEDVLVKVKNKEEMIRGGEARRFVKDPDAVDEIQEMGVDECVKDFAVILAGRWCHACEGMISVDKITSREEKFDSCGFFITKILIEVSYDDGEMSVGVVLLNLFDKVCYMLGSWVNIIKVPISCDGSPLMHPGSVYTRCCKGFHMCTVCVVYDHV